MTDRERVAVQLREDIPALIAAKILDQTAAERLTAYYPLPVRRDYRKRLILFFGVLGALLIGGGLTMIAAHNWDMMPLAGRLASAGSPVLAAWIFGGWVLLRRAGAAVWCESAALLIFAALGAALGIVSQQYHSTGTLAELVTILMLFGIYLIYAFRSIGVLLLFAAGFGFVPASGNSLLLFGMEQFYILLVLLIAVLPRIVGTLRSQPWGIGAQACRFSLTFMLIMLTVAGADSAGTLQYYLWAVLFACLLRFGLLSVRVSRINPFLLSGLAGLLIECSILSFAQAWGWRQGVAIAELSSVSVTACILATLLYSVIGWISIMRDDKFIVWMPLVFPLLVLGNLWYPLGNMSCVMFNVFMAFCGLYLLTRGVRRRRMWYLNFGMGVLLLQVVLRFCGASDNYLLNGVVFIVSGLVFIGVNFFAVRYFLKKREAA